MFEAVGNGKAGRSRKARPGSHSQPTDQGKPPDEDALFDLWLERRLREEFKEVFREPVPPQLVALIQSRRLNS